MAETCRDLADPTAAGAELGMTTLVERHDWTVSPLGGRASWSPTLRVTVDLMLASGHAMCVMWGPERTFLYNDAYAPFLGDRHPSALGRPTAEVWPDVWSDIGPLVERTFAGETCTFDGLPLLMTRHGFEEETWWNFSYSPVRDEDGRVAGLLNVTSEVTGRVVAERERDAAVTELRASEEFTRGVLASSTDCIKVLDLEGRLTFMSEGGQRVMEVSDFNAIAGCPWPDFWAGPGNDEAKAAIDAARAGRASSFVGQAGTMAGNVKWWHVAVSPIPGPDGEPARILSISRDISDVRQREEERDRFVRLAENSSDFVAMAGLDGRVTYLNAAGRRLVGLGDVDNATLAITDLFPPGDLDEVLGVVLPAVERDGSWSGELCLLDFGGADPIPTLCSVFPITDAAGTMVGYGTVVRDNRERKRNEEDMGLLNGELAHRLKNVLAIVQSVVHQTLRKAPDVEAASTALGARLVALGAATDVLTARSWRAADLRELATRALAPHATVGERILLDGPDVTLRPEVALAFALALHELATNAVKYGALSNERGAVALSWTVDGVGEDAAFELAWRERGGPTVSPPERRGFGSTLIERSLRSYFGGAAATDYHPDGLRFDLKARLADAAIEAGT